MAQLHTPPQTGTARNDVRRLEGRIKRLVEEGNVSQARREISQIPSGVSESLDRWRILLSEPRGKREEAATGGGLRRNIAWLQENSERYSRQWVALKNGRFLGSDPSRRALRSSLKEAGELKGALFFRVEE
ncbi:MAG: hypothetical protein V1792_19655 [Pseudomonadota bacterium]